MVSFSQKRAELIEHAAANVVKELLLRDTETDAALAQELIRAGIPHPFPEADDRADELFEARRDAA